MRHNGLWAEFFFHIHHNKFKVVWQKKNRTEKNLKFIEYCKIFCTSIYISLTLNHSWTLSKKSTKNTSDTANYTALNTGHQNNDFHCKRDCQICFSTCDSKISACLLLAWLLLLRGAALLPNVVDYFILIFSF